MFNMIEFFKILSLSIEVYSLEAFSTDASSFGGSDDVSLMGQPKKCMG